MEKQVSLRIAHVRINMRKEQPGVRKQLDAAEALDLDAERALKTRDYKTALEDLRRSEAILDRIGEVQ